MSDASSASRDADARSWRATSTWTSVLTASVAACAQRPSASGLMRMSRPPRTRGRNVRSGRRRIRDEALRHAWGRDETCVSPLRLVAGGEPNDRKVQIKMSFSPRKKRQIPGGRVARMASRGPDGPLAGGHGWLVPARLLSGREAGQARGVGDGGQVRPGGPSVRRGRTRPRWGRVGRGRTATLPPDGSLRVAWLGGSDLEDAR